MSSLNFQHIEYFIEVCQSRSISDAALHLYISQQALSRSIRVLEEQLGYTLLERTSKGVQMTQAGSSLYETFLPIVLSYKEAERQVLSKGNNAPGHFGYSETLIADGESMKLMLLLYAVRMENTRTNFETPVFFSPLGKTITS